MTDLSLLATVLAKGLAQPTSINAPPSAAFVAFDRKSTRSRRKHSSKNASQPKALLQPNVQPDSRQDATEFSQPKFGLPSSCSQFYWQRFAALRSGRLYTRLPIDSFRDIWLRATGEPTYNQWRTLLALEAKAATGGQGNRRLSVMVGDSLSLWFPSDRLPTGQLWLNQAISGENTSAILQRLPAFANARPQAIYVMAGINDLKQGATDNDILWNLRQIVRRLQQSHPHARIVVQSILPTRTAIVPGNRIGWLNEQLAAIAKQDGAIFLDLYSQFTDADGSLRRELTTDGLHLNANGYATWQAQLAQADTWLARGG
ncbi:MAG: lysophospholipase [Tildeniella nuda ZEHNDER 1965/U140]|jgi:lysophospholipase L1-like esterase|nr:lysophospholipase [Tildeniella nuda ZEHNDER 1965/U140]